MQRTKSSLKKWYKLMPWYTYCTCQGHIQFLGNFSLAQPCSSFHRFISVQPVRSSGGHSKVDCLGKSKALAWFNQEVLLELWTCSNLGVPKRSLCITLPIHFLSGYSNKNSFAPSKSSWDLNKSIGNSEHWLTERLPEVQEWCPKLYFVKM